MKILIKCYIPVIVGLIISVCPSVDMDTAPLRAVPSIRHPFSLYLFKTDGCGNPNLLFLPDEIMITSGLTFSMNISLLDVLLPWCGAKRTVLFSLSPAIAISSYSARISISPGNRKDSDPNDAFKTMELLFTLRHLSSFLFLMKSRDG